MKMADISYSRKEKAQMLADELAEEEFGMDFYDLDIRTQMKIYQIALDMIDEGGGNAMGGRERRMVESPFARVLWSDLCNSIRWVAQSVNG